VIGHGKAERDLGKDVVPKLTKIRYTNPMQVPKLEKVIINMGLGEAIKT
jgi:large subunit ribosomal protein L5